MLKTLLGALLVALTIPTAFAHEVTNVANATCRNQTCCGNLATQYQTECNNCVGTSNPNGVKPIKASPGTAHYHYQQPAGRRCRPDTLKM
jgi:hypothetical protein